MPRYIDADGLQKSLKNICTGGGKWGEAERMFIEAFSDFVDGFPVHDVIEDAPTADVRENVHGKWLMSNVSKLRPYMCSRCESLYDVDTVMGRIVWNYCPNCGARMSERRDDAEVH